MGSLLAAAAACGPGDGGTRSPVMGPGLLVEIEPAAEAAYEHPAHVDPEQLTRMLAALRYEKGVTGLRTRTLFAPSSAQALGAGIAQGLARATPAQRVRFRVRVEPGEDRPLYVPEQRHTRGVAFVEPAGVLNLAFDLVDETAGPNAPPANDPQDGKGRANVRLVPPEGAEAHVRPSGRPAPMWITWAWPAASADTASDPPSDGVPPDTEALVRLRQLEELHRDGVISDEDYERRKNQILFGDEAEGERDGADENAAPPPP